jgi:glucarate dehydratase
MNDPNGIARVKATVVNVPALRTCAWSGGATTGCTRTIIEVETADGLVGLGEAPGDGAGALIASRLAARITGLSVLERSSVRRLCVGDHRDFGALWDPVRAFAYAGIEMALWDILAKRLGAPLHAVLGGAVRPAAQFSAYAYSVDTADGYAEAEVPSVMAEIARTSLAESGSSMFEFKIGRHSLDRDIETIYAVREAVGPGIALGVDANMAFSPTQARRFFEATREARLANVEEPVATLAEMERLRRDFGVPISTHCTDFDALGAYPLIEGVVGDLHGDGGLAANLVNAQVAQGFGRQYWLRSCQELGIAFAAFCHIGMASKAMTRPAQTLINWVEHPLTAGPRWRVSEGGVVPPSTPGLGVELDQDALAHYHDRYRREGPLTYYDKP